MTKLPIGGPLSPFPGATFNRLVDLLGPLERSGEIDPTQLAQIRQLAAQLADAPRPALSVVVENETGAALQELGVGEIDQPSWTYSTLSAATGTATAADLAAPVLRLKSPTAGGKIAVVHAPIADAKAGVATIQGLSVVRLDVVSDSHTTAGLSAGVTTHLVTGGPGAQIVWKQSGTGWKWGLVSLDAVHEPSPQPIYACRLLADISPADTTATVELINADGTYAAAAPVVVKVQPDSVTGFGPYTAATGAQFGDVGIVVTAIDPETDATYLKLDSVVTRAPIGLLDDGEDLYQVEQYVSAGSNWRIWPEELPGLDVSETNITRRLLHRLCLYDAFSRTYQGFDSAATAVLVESLGGASWSNAAKQLTPETAAGKLLSWNGTIFQAPQDVTLYWRSKKAVAIATGKGLLCSVVPIGGKLFIESLDCEGDSIDYT